MAWYWLCLHRIRPKIGNPYGFCFASRTFPKTRSKFPSFVAEPSSIPFSGDFPVCPLCLSTDTKPICHDTKRFESPREYFRCLSCDLIFVPPDQHLTPKEEKLRYDQHENDPSDPRYRTFLRKLADPVLNAIPPDSCGLDFGCGPGSAMPRLFGHDGHRIRLYDPLYFPDQTAFQETYDFIVCSETAEHLSDPRREFLRCWGILKEGGVFGLMTLRHDPSIDFDHWHYRMDDTHVCFYSDRTIHTIARLLKATVQIVSNRVVLFHKVSPV